MLKENKDKKIERLRREVDRLNEENLNLKNKISELEKMTNFELAAKFEESNRLLNEKIAEIDKAKEQYEKLISLQDKYVTVLRNRYKKGTNKAIKDFNKALNKK